MITDLRTRIWSSLDQFGLEVATLLRSRYASRWESLDASPAAHERAMECVTNGCVLGFRSAMLDAHVPNELIAQFVAGDPRRRIGFGGIDPLVPGAVEEVDEAVHLGLSGITISPAAQGFHPSHSAAMRVYEHCADLGLPVIVASDIPMSSSCMLEFARPAAFDEVARSIPQLKLIIGDFGHPWTSETMALIGKHGNVFTDVAGLVSRPWELFNVLLTAANRSVMDRVLFGSGFPFETPARAIESLYSINSFSQGTQLPSIARALIRGIVERDTLEVLGIDVDTPAVATPSRPADPAGPAHAAVADDLDADAVELRE